MEAEDSDSDWSDVLPKPFEVKKRVENLQKIVNKYKNDTSNKTISCHLISSPEESEDDIDDDDSEGMVDEQVERASCNQIQMKHPAFNPAKIVEGLRTKIAKLEKLLPKDVLLCDPPSQRPSGVKCHFTRSTKRFLSPNYEHRKTAVTKPDGVKVRKTNHKKAKQTIMLNHRSLNYKEAVHSNSDDSMCSMEQDNYLRQNMGKRRPSNNRSQKIICKNKIIKKYSVVTSSSSHSYRQSVPFYAPQSTTLCSRRRPYKYSRNRTMTGSETETSGGGCSRKRSKRIKTLELDQRANECRQRLPSADLEEKCRNFALVLKRITPADMNLGNLLNIGEETSASLTSKPKIHENQVLSKEPTNLAISEAVLQPLYATPTRETGNAIHNSPIRNDNNRLTQEIDVDDHSPEKLPAPPTTKRVAQPEPIDLIVISSDTDGDERNMSNLSFADYVWIRNERHRLAQETDSDDLEMISGFRNIVLGKDDSLGPTSAGTQNVACQNRVDRKEKVLIHKGDPEAPPDAKMTIDRTLVESKLGSELATKLFGSFDYKKIIPATKSVYFVPPSRGYKPIPIISSDEEDVGVKLGTLRYYDAGEDSC